MGKKIYLEAIRGVAALIVVFHHFFAAFYPSTVFGNEYPMHGSWETLFTHTPLGVLIAGKFAVCVFFILSGFVLSLQYFGDTAKDANHLLAAAVKRPFRLGGMVVFSVAISFLLLQWGLYFNGPVSHLTDSVPYFESFWSQGAVGFRHFLVDIVFKTFSSASQYNGPLWTIETELYGSLITYGFLLIFRDSNWRLLGYAVAVLYFHGSYYQGFLYGIFLADISRNFPSIVTRFSRPAFSVPCLAVGLFFASFPVFVNPVRLSGTLYGLLPSLPGAFTGSYAMLGAIAVFGGLLLNPFLQQVLSMALFSFLGRISYALYAIHFLVIGSFSSWLFLLLQRHLSYDLSFAIVLAASLVLIVGLSDLISRLVDIPATRGANWIGRMWLKSIGKALPGQTAGVHHGLPPKAD